MAKMIEQEKKWFVKEPAKLEEILEAAGLLANNELIVKAIYADINRLYAIKSYADTFIRKSVIVSHYAKRRRYKIKLLDTVLANKWLFYTQEIEMGADVLIQPVFDMEKMTERKINSLIKAITNNDYEKVKKLVPNDVANCQQNANGTATDCKPVDNALSTHFTSPIISTRVDAKENREKRIGEKENKRFNQNQSINKEPIVGNQEPSCLVDCDKTTDFSEEIGLKSWKDYLDNLKVESKEAQCLINCAYDDAGFFEQNFDKFKDQLWNIVQLRGKFKDPNLLSNFRKNGYVVNLLRSANERNRLIEDIKKSIVFMVQTEFRYHKEGYKYDLFNEDGDRMSGGKIIPRDAPPQPSPDHWWNFPAKKWCR